MDYTPVAIRACSHTEKGTEKRDNNQVHQPMRREKTGNFRATAGQRPEDDRLIDRVEFRVTSRDWRQLQIMYSQHRQEFGWEIPSDMYRDMLLIGLSEAASQVKNPTSEMVMLRQQAAEIVIYQSGALKHARVNDVFSTLSSCINSAFESGDLAEVRRMLAEFKEQTESTADLIVKQRRVAEFESRYGNLWESLNRPALLPGMKGNDNNGDDG